MIYKDSDGWSSGRNRRYKRQRGWIGWVVALVIILAVAGGIKYGYDYVMGDVNGTNGTDEAVIIDIPHGATSDSISELLEEYGIVKSKFLFRNYLRFFCSSTPTFMYGPHELRSNMSYEEIIPVLEQPMLDLRETMTLRFIDGWTALKMGLYLEDEGICTVDEWLDACNGVYDVEFYDKISDSPDKFTKLEGFLFPDTYEFYEDVTPEEIVEKMLVTFGEKVLGDSDITNKLAISEFTLEEIVILASIIEKETGDVNEIFKVSSVFHNRLAPGSPLDSLQSCATQKYTVGVLDYYFIDMKGESTPEQMEYRYDTYMSQGLMVGSICNPGHLSIHAALNPEDTPYYYFLMDNTGKTYYAETNSGHEENKRAMRAVNAEVASGAGAMD